MKLYRWKAEADIYSRGKFNYFIFKKNALRWLDDHSSYDVLSFTDRWKGKTVYLKDRLYGRTGSPVATIILHQPGGVDIIYNDLVPTVEED
jgi:hypothetical protein